MCDDAIAMTAMLGLPGFRVLVVYQDDGEVEAGGRPLDQGWWRSCGAQATLHNRRPSWVRDLPAAGRPVRLVWVKRIRRCHDPRCPTQTWTETHDQGAAACVFDRAGMSGGAPPGRPGWTHGCRGGFRSRRRLGDGDGRRPRVRAASGRRTGPAGWGAHHGGGRDRVLGRHPAFEHRVRHRDRRPQRTGQTARRRRGQKRNRVVRLGFWPRRTLAGRHLGGGAGSVPWLCRTIDSWRPIGPQIACHLYVSHTAGRWRGVGAMPRCPRAGGCMTRTRQHGPGASQCNAFSRGRTSPHPTQRHSAGR